MNNRGGNITDLSHLRNGEPRDEFDKIQTVQDAQLAQVRQQLRGNEKQMAQNDENQALARKQWRLVFAADIYKFHRHKDCDKGRPFDAELDKRVAALLRAEFPEALEEEQVNA